MTVNISSGILRGSSAAASHVWALPLHVPGHCGWEPTHRPGHPLRPPPPNAHVLLLLQPVFDGRLLHLHHHSQEAGEHPDAAKAISYAGCITQMFFLLFVELDNFLLAVMAYDKFVAIFNPLHCMVIMNLWLSVQLVLVCWVISVLNSLLQSLILLWLSCTYLEFPHFFYELNQVTQLTYYDTFLNDMVMYIAIILLAVGPLAGILYSCSKIISIHAIPSAQGKYKAFSTCASHISVVSSF